MKVIVQGREPFVVVACGFIGWALCAATMGIAMRLTALPRALVAHAVAAPLIFVVVSLFYFRRRSPWSPLSTAVGFLVTVAWLDFFVVALAIQRSLAMFASPLGVWLPFLLIFVATWLTGITCRKGGLNIPPRQAASRSYR